MSGWVTATVKTDKANELERRFDDIYGTVVRDDELILRFSGRGDEGRKNAIKLITDQIDSNEAEFIAVINANDTSDAGNGVVLEPSGWVKGNYYEGYEGARANDVAGMIYEDYDFRPWTK